jgi:hypothetical protein
MLKIFEYEIGLVQISYWTEAKNDIVKYVVTADDKLIDGQVERIKTIWYSASSRRGCRCRFKERLQTKKRN